MNIPSSQSFAVRMKRAAVRIAHGKITQDLDFWTPDKEKKVTGSRMAVTISDIHLTDATVGIQNLEIHDWKSFFGEIEKECDLSSVKSCYLIFDGDLVDFIRTDRWARAGVYPWDVDSDQYVTIVDDIMDGIAEKHKNFFEHLVRLPERLRGVRVEFVQIIVLIGNHDKPILKSRHALSRLYELIYGVPVHRLPTGYREWIGRMYFDDPGRFQRTETVPWLPFYFADKGFQYFVTHGHWRDPYNSRKIKSGHGKPSWTVCDGWRIDKWKKLNYAPFTEPCFGDTVAAGVLSTFIYRAREQLAAANIVIERLDQILGELDLYRPTYKAVTRILKEAKGGRKRDASDQGQAANIIEETMTRCIQEWLDWKFTIDSATPSVRRWLHIFRIFLKLFGHVRIQLQSIRFLMQVLAWKQKLQGAFNPGMAITDLKTLPAFLPEYRDYGLRIHGEGHTHEATQEEPNLHDKKTSTYVNFGTWRDRIVARKRNGYRRRATSRAFYLLDLEEEGGKATRSLRYRTGDRIEWADALDDLGSS